MAVYIRLSREDSRSCDESESVTNQRSLLEKHIAQFNDGDDYIIIKEYVDDGISGTTDDERDSFQAMLTDIKNGRINCVIVKDLARSFRNYSDQGYYLDDWFPRHNVRFISLFHQSLDSYKEPRTMRNIAVPIQGVMNENHCAETSDKIREVFNDKRAKGEHIGSFALYGYLKDPQNHNALIVDKEAAAVVRNIYTLFLEGKSKNSIVRTLNEQGVLCPSIYKREVLKLNYTNPKLDPAKKPLWTATTLTTILKNRIYCGDMVQGRYRIKSYKIHVQERVPEEEWYIVQNTHEPIIDRTVFEKVQTLLKKNTRTGPQQNMLYLFSGFLRCADCNKAMGRTKAGEYVYYHCRTYKHHSKEVCTKHSVKHDLLEKAVLYAVQQQIYLGVHHSKTMEQVDKAPSMKNQSIILTHVIDKKKKELTKIARYKQAVWQDWKDNEISRAEYCHMSEDYNRQAENLKQAIKTLERERAEQEKAIDNIGRENPLLAAFRQHENITNLTREIVIELIDTIKVYEKGNISVRFKFQLPTFQLPQNFRTPKTSNFHLGAS
ncbi:MAG: recombinase family protein [Peptococcaceae bacterium]|nr:recombinase family protein [Peptococcaceae bacterium]